MHSDQYNAIFNGGERLIPGESHDLAETVRHKSSYRFFRQIIEDDLKLTPGQTFRILDLGCGVGHGTFDLAKLSNVEIVGIDPSPESIQYALGNYAAGNISYVNTDALSFLERGEAFHYVVSRHALEHVDNGLEIARQFNCSRRLMINVPYKEPEGNIHHKLHFIDESSFIGYDGAEFFFEDLNGVTDISPERLEFANSVVCVLTHSHLPSVAKILEFPFAPWKPELQERILIDTSATVKELQSRLANFDGVIHSLGDQLTVALAEIAFTKTELASTKTELNALRNMLLLRILRKISRIANR